MCASLAQRSPRLRSRSRSHPDGLLTTPGLLASRFLLQTRSEKFNYEVNIRCYIHIRGLTNVMEYYGLLSTSNPLHVGAFSTLMQPLMQVGLDRMMRAWNQVRRQRSVIMLASARAFLCHHTSPPPTQLPSQHSVAAVPGWPGSGGRPADRVRLYPPRAGRAVLPPDFDAVGEYEAVLPALRTEPEGAARRDALYGRTAAQTQRQLAVAQAVGGARAEELWDEIVNGYHDRFIAAYCTYLQYM